MSGDKDQWDLEETKGFVGHHFRKTQMSRSRRMKNKQELFRARFCRSKRVARRL